MRSPRPERATTSPVTWCRMVHSRARVARGIGRRRSRRSTVVPIIARRGRSSSTRIWEATSIRIPLTGAVGDVFEFGASVQRLDAELTEIDVFLLTPESEPETHRRTPVPDMSWVRVTGTLTLTKPVDSLTIGVGANVDKLRALGVDRVWLRRLVKK